MDTRYMLTLLSTLGIGRKTVQTVLNYTPSSVKELHDILLESKKKNQFIHMPTKEALDEAFKKAKKISEHAERLGIKIIGYDDQDFPNRLKIIPDPPVILYVKGNTDCLMQNLSVAVVGTREPTPYGTEWAERFGYLFAEKGLIVVSGLAVGCDTSAHKGCLKAGGRTVAVLAHGLDRIYPSVNRALAEQILAFDGCLVSEYPPGEKPQKSFFIDRDRLQTGLSSAVVVVETDIKGGTMHTVGFCLKQGKLLGCLMHPPEYASVKSRGNMQLITEGKATPLNGEAGIGDFIAKLSSNIPPLPTDRDALPKVPGAMLSSPSINLSPIVSGKSKILTEKKLSDF